MRFTGKSVVITGATGGLGRAAAQRFYDEGANIALVDLHQKDIDALLQTFDADSRRIIGIEADVSKDGDVKNYVNETMSVFGRIDTLFNNAGIEGSISSLENYEEEIFDRVVQVNIKGVWLGMRYCADAMRKSGGGSIINTASAAGLMATPSLICTRASFKSSRSALNCLSFIFISRNAVSISDRDNSYFCLYDPSELSVSSNRFLVS